MTEQSPEVEPFLLQIKQNQKLRIIYKNGCPVPDTQFWSAVVGDD